MAETKVIRIYVRAPRSNSSWSLPVGRVWNEQDQDVRLFDLDVVYWVGMTQQDGQECYVLEVAAQP
ncbi:hypothetical protein KC887_04425 [Candidatus Kaiserbacteria bacterium]|nr:hypothetical protein [Candidatus Kaiserbacteria bacterium]